MQKPLNGWNIMNLSVRNSMKSVLSKIHSTWMIKMNNKKNIYLHANSRKSDSTSKAELTKYLKKKLV